jgi:hypothetical protein
MPHGCSDERQIYIYFEAHLAERFGLKLCHARAEIFVVFPGKVPDLDCARQI